MIALKIAGGRRHFLLLLIVFLGIIFLLLLQLFRSPTNAYAVFFDVPGESIFVTTKSGHRILIDGGMTPEVTEKLAKHLPYWDKRIDVIILTHADKDHLFGVLETLRYYPTDSLFLTGAVHESQLYQEFLKEAKQLNTKIFFVDETLDIRAGKTLVDIISPHNSILGIQGQKSNTGSVVGKIYSNETSILFTGDIGKSEEETLLQQPLLVSANILSVPHHGSKSSSSEAFIAAVSPKQAVISASKHNPYGHPHEETITKYKNRKIPLSITGKSGDILILLSE